MVFNNERNVTIFYMKFLKAIFVTEDLNALLSMAQEFGINYTSTELLKMLRDLVISCTKNNSLPEVSFQNLQNYINICRFNEDTNDKKERFEICNEILGYLNASMDKKPFPLYRSMLNSLYPNILERIKYQSLLFTRPEVVTSIISSSTELEYLILFFQSSCIEDEEFEESISEELILSLTYLLATYHLLRQYPDLLQDKLYLSRLNYVLKNNELLLKKYNGNLDDVCHFDLDLGDEETLKDKQFWKIHKKVKKKALKAQKDS